MKPYKPRAGDRVRMTVACKLKMLGDCRPDMHVKPWNFQGDMYCMACSMDHVEEFGDCEGIVEGPVDYNNPGEVHDQTKIGPEWNVRWIISKDPTAFRPRFGYAAEDLEKVLG